MKTWIAASRALALSAAVLAGIGALAAQEKKPTFAEVKQKMSAEKPAVTKRHQELLAKRYDLSDKPAQGVTMTRGKPVQGGVRARPPAGTTWKDLAAMTPEDIREKGLFPAGFLPLPHPNHPEGGMLFPKFHIDTINKQ